MADGSLEALTACISGRGEDTRDSGEILETVPGLHRHSDGNFSLRGDGNTQLVLVLEVMIVVSDRCVNCPSGGQYGHLRHYAVLNPTEDVLSGIYALILRVLDVLEQPPPAPKTPEQRTRIPRSQLQHCDSASDPPHNLVPCTAQELILACCVHPTASVSKMPALSAESSPAVLPVPPARMWHGHERCFRLSRRSGVHMNKNDNTDIPRRYEIIAVLF
ncbi:hypothetical protein QBC43DRAFT_334031 [Cladorrhinum sp. PSN259]|nr:hypothetical protein QBC43DRAFT_334031 [Cladorrhinum sp. PSN259]